MLIRGQAYPRAGLVGNPSDGYFGKTISFTFRNFAAEVVLEESKKLAIVPGVRETAQYDSIDALAEDVRRHGYYGGVRLLKAAVKQFHHYCAAQGLRLHDRNFTLQYDTDIPPLVGLAGSSAIITACFRALMAFYNVNIAPALLANQVLASEAQELGIPAGLQDRVAQAYDGLVYMDFDRELMDRHGHGNYERLDLAALPPLYIAWRTELAEGTEVFHNDVRARWERGEPEVVAAMKTWASFATQVRDMLASGEGRAIGPILNANFDLRRKIFHISEGNIQLVETARAAGASAKFTGSGGAIIGTYENEAMFQKLKSALESVQAQVIKPDFAPPKDSA